MGKSEMQNLRDKMKGFIEKECLLKKNFKLSAGGQSLFYFDIKKASLNGEFLHCFSEYVLAFLEEQGLRPHVVGGMTIGADFLTAGLVLKAHEKKHVMSQGSIVRKQSKSHGTENLIENNLADNSALEKDILVIDDVVTSGSSIEKAYQEFVTAGYEPVALLTVVDREEGGIEHLKKVTGLPVLAIFKSSEFSL